MNRILNLSPFSRPTWAEIDLDALRHNVRHLRSRNNNLILPVLKANAYGHGAIACAEALQGDLQSGEMMCVASVDEGIQLRRAGIMVPILLLSALLPQEADACVEHQLTATVSGFALANALDAAAKKMACRAFAHYKIDSGMGRAGVAPDQAVQLWHRLTQLRNLEITGIYTHFACADEDDDAMSVEQCSLFKKTLKLCGVDRKEESKAPMFHAANSAATWRYAFAAFDAVRPGISVYGVSPFESKVLSDELHADLRSVMKLKAQVTLVKHLQAGATVSYGATWKASKTTRIALIPVGYADGYHRSLSNCGKVLLRGTLCPVVGRVTMDQSIIDVTALKPDVQVGETVTLWGGNLPVEDIATLAGTIGYEMLTGVAARIPRIYQ